MSHPTLQNMQWTNDVQNENLKICLHGVQKKVDELILRKLRSLKSIKKSKSQFHEVLNFVDI